MLVVGLGAAAASFSSVCVPRLRLPRSAAVDVLPLWLGAGLVLRGEDPLSAVAAKAQFTQEGLPLRPGGFYSYYPPTASVLALPLRPLGFRRAVAAVRWGGALATPLGVALAVAAPFAVRRQPGWGLAAAAVGVWLGVGAMFTRPARVVLGTGQVGPWLVLSAGLALVLLALGRTRAAAFVAGAGAALKLAPLALVPGLLLRAPRAAGALVAVPLVASAVLVGFGVPLHPVAWAAALLDFAAREPPPDLLGRAGVVEALIGMRVGLAVVGVLVAGALLWRRSRGPAPPLHVGDSVNLAVTGMAALGLVLSGSPHTHEALLALPAIGVALAWPFTRPSVLAGVAAAALLLSIAGSPEAFAADAPRDALYWPLPAALALAISVLRAGLRGDGPARTG